MVCLRLRKVDSHAVSSRIYDFKGYSHDTEHENNEELRTEVSVSSI